MAFPLDFDEDDDYIPQISVPKRLVVREDHYEENLKRDAVGGDLDAQVELCYLYESLESGPQYEDAVRFYLLAADQGSVKAYRALAKLHFHGFGLPQDSKSALNYLALAGEPESEADRWYLERIRILAAAQNDDPAAMYTIGLWYQDGEEYETDGWYEYNIEKDLARSRAWFENAAAAGFEPAQKRIETFDCTSMHD